jgi:hypothetical protein
MVTGWGASLSSLAFCVRQVFEVAREVYACVVEAGGWFFLVLDSDYANAVLFLSKTYVRSTLSDVLGFRQN